MTDEVEFEDEEPAEADDSGAVDVDLGDDVSAAPEAAPEEPEHSQPTPQLIAVGAGRGGAGKSLLSASVAIYLAQLGKRVVAVDADPAGGTLHHMLGATRPARGFGTFLRGHGPSLEELAVDTAVAGVRQFVTR